MNNKVFFLFLLLFTISEISAQSSDSGNVEKVLFLYEESNRNIDPWLVLFRKGFAQRQISFDERSAAAIDEGFLASFDRIYLYGAVMGFTFREPVRDWLKSSPELSGKKISLFVTCNRWFLDKYTRQLQKLLTEGDAILVDTVTSATKNLTEEEKIALINQLLD